MKYFNTIEHLLNMKPFKNFKVVDEHIKTQLNNIISKFDKKYIYNKSEMICNLIRYNVDGDWVDRLIRSEKYKRDGMSLDGLIVRYGEDVGKILHEERGKLVATTKDKYIQKYGNDIGILKWNDLCKKKISFKREYYIEKYGNVEGELRWESVLTRKLNTQSENFKDKRWKNGRTLDEYQTRYGIKDGYERWMIRNKRQSYAVSLRRYIDEFGPDIGKTICKKLKDNSSLSSFIERYGNDVGKIKYIENCNKIGITLERMVNKYGDVEGEYRYKNWIESISAAWQSQGVRGVSKSSQKLFWLIYNELDNDIKNDVYFYELNEEYKVFRHTNDSIKLLKLDFKVGNKIIEFDCDYWHDEDSDADRDMYLTSKSYKILRINYNDFVKDEKLVVEKCINFIKNET